MFHGLALGKEPIMNTKYDSCHFCATCRELEETDPLKCEHTATVHSHNKMFGRECPVDRDCAAFYHWHSDEKFRAHVDAHTLYGHSEEWWSIPLYGKEAHAQE